MLKALAILTQAAATILALAGTVVTFKAGIPALQQMFAGLQAEPVAPISVAGHDFSPVALIALCLIGSLVLFFVARSLYHAAEKGAQ